ncbi:MAG: YfgM family protein [Inhella sp.]|jgi:predicted negative regulator of RcsB-dependent stress response|uniref:YfgM family protein n=1 Tax=Inhella sp. TaxID=1921806 RepID=UPI0022CA82E3|nr:tetratricopeptide repeat protein [Inhella sp.]MCZ8236149.1 tetratricopeptide repeat protein [Inhella sp.]
MATLDLEEQQQLDNLKAFWAKWGNLISGVLTLALLAFAGWNGWQEWQRRENVAAGRAYDAVEAAVQSKDLKGAAGLWAQMQTEHPRTTYTTQAGLVLAQAQMAQAQRDEATQVLTWVGAQGRPALLKELALLRLSGLHLEAERYAEAEAALAAIKDPAYAALVADRRGDAAQLQSKPDEARAHYEKAYTGMTDQQNYRRLVEAKLMALGVNPAKLVAVEVKP